MNSYKKEIIYACGFSIGLTSCAISILLGYANLALFMLLTTSVFILLEIYSLFLKIDGGASDHVSQLTASLKPDAYSMPDAYSYQDDIESVSEPVIIHKSDDN
ncbi:MAG: hypothetical protein K2M60_06650 [Lachnospiraceae bacterium]|nr:hypothetical protein [Lachnospiraceae bacterium]MDE6254347.1 hypothetical protein [Lachnospiraceae bacterium]